MTAYGSKDLNGTVPAERQAVEGALAYLGADPQDTRLVRAAMPPVPDCPGWQPPVTLPPGQTCQSYTLPCSFHALLGQLWSRRELYLLMVDHEKRRGDAFRFDNLLYIRPDLTATLPLLPWCFHPWHVSRHLHDWVWAVPRGEAEGAFAGVANDYYGCRKEYLLSNYQAGFANVTDFAERSAERPETDTVGNFRKIMPTNFDIENWMKVRAAAHGVQFFLDDSLGTLALTRTNDPKFPHRFDCRFFAIALRTLIPTGAQPKKEFYLHHSLIADVVQQSSNGKSLAACAKLIYANPANRPQQPP
jgi:hypothetical protein